MTKVRRPAGEDFTFLTRNSMSSGAWTVSRDGCRARCAFGCAWRPPHSTRGVQGCPSSGAPRPCGGWMIEGQIVDPRQGLAVGWRRHQKSA